MNWFGIFLDRDGVLIQNVSSYVRTWDEVEPFSYTTSCLSRLAALAPLFVITNQAIVGRGHMKLDAIWALHNRIISEIDPLGLIKKSYLCPHSPLEGCDCRKPLPGNLFRAAREFDLDLSRSWLIGDAMTDVEAAYAAGVTPILVRTGRGADEEILNVNPGLRVVDTLLDAAELIEGAGGSQKEEVRSKKGGGEVRN